MIKLFEFLRRAPGVGRDDFRAAWIEHGAESRRLGGRYVQNHAIPGARVPGLTLSDFDCVDEFWLETVDGLEAGLPDGGPADVIDTAATIRLVAEESVRFDRGFGAVKFIGLSRRSGEFATREDWIRYWIDVHGPLAHDIPEFTRHYGRYVHNYVVPSPIGAGGADPDFDGIVEEWLESVDAFIACLQEPKYLEIVRPDELRFVDFSRSHMLVTEEHVVHDRAAQDQAGQTSPSTSSTELPAGSRT